MKIITLKEINITPLDIRFKQSSFVIAIGLALVTGLMAGAVFWHYRKGFPLSMVIIGCGILTVFLLVLIMQLKKSLAQDNWILLIKPNQIFVKFRSYLNSHYHKEDPQVVSFQPDEIEYARITKQKMINFGKRNSKTLSFHSFLDLCIMKQDLSPLKQQITYERNIKIKSVSSAHYPVSIAEEHIVRIEWRSHHDYVTPGLKKALAALSAEGIRIESLNKETVDLTITPTDKNAMETKILRLAEQGENIAAIRLTRKVYGLSLSEAKNFVEGLTKQ